MTEKSKVFNFPRTDTSPSDARKAVRQAIISWGVSGETVDTVELLVSELVTNAIKHAHGSRDCRLICKFSENELSVAVMDQSSMLPKPRSAKNEEANGRGLMLVKLLADSWGTHSLLCGKAVFFKLIIKSQTQTASAIETKDDSIEYAPRHDTGATRSAVIYGWRPVLIGLWT